MTIKSDLKVIASIYRQNDNVKIAADEYKKDKVCGRFIFHCMIDRLCKDGYISEKTWQNVDITLNKHNELVLHCLSYSLKI